MLCQGAPWPCTYDGIPQVFWYLKYVEGASEHDVIYKPNGLLLIVWLVLGFDAYRGKGLISRQTGGITAEPSYTTINVGVKRFLFQEENNGLKTNQVY